MIKVTYNTSSSALEKIKIGDEIMDEYQSSGKVVKITKNVKDGFSEYTFLLDSRQTIFIISATT